MPHDSSAFPFAGPMAGVLLSAFSLGVSSTGLAQEDGAAWPIEVTVAAGLQYDDLVTVEELDQVRNVGDAAAVLDLDLDYERNFDQGTDLSLGYSLSQKSYFDESEFDLQIHNLSFGLKQNFEHFDLGIETYHVQARLDGDELLSFTHLSPYFTRFLTRRLYLRGSYFYRDKDFPENPGRDGNVHAADADLYFFIDGTRHYVVAGLRYEDEDTRDAAFDYRGQQLELRYSRRFDLYGERPVRLRLDWRYEDRDYRSVTPSIGQRRDDQRQRWRVRVDLPISQRLTALLSYQYRDHESDLPSADFSDNRFEAQLEMSF
ncbi:surface lipoprotein assembly modifier [Wenzhouxiangella marina]|uniref:Surface lipoprotein assembly modifier C-terminal domain-containing protein n=1 Tax=Wenzhouxiangella marina TaxID=1579979 RepID=A0A0K0XTS9_9GAMM|nr:surface lipoprotein assembly modifier [Wenzhouxiangella marina]AKS41119.1 hypothetical protein WM2015_738 [Wenzhouxiangella marina]MBB6087998.1 hypothetical protein [Wenzhouxiangella marina]